MSNKPKVLVAMSGGVDSSVAAALLKEQGYDCIGVYMNLWADPTQFAEEDAKKFPQNKCCSIESLMLARSICQRLEIPFYSINFEEIFKAEVVDYFLDQHQDGDTPNPCVRCNKKIKFGALFDKMLELGCDYLATGHYAKLNTDKEGNVHLIFGEDDTKDQTYFLYNLTQEQLKKIKFPIGEFNKSKVRALAKKYDLKEIEKKKESQGVCFYPEKTYMPFLTRYLKEGKDFQKGEILDASGQKIGEHEGLPFYTIGQRKGIKIGGGPALYVNKVDKLKNAIIVGSENELFTNEISVKDLNFINPIETNKTYQMRIRHHGRLTNGKLIKTDDSYKVIFEEPQRGVMSGQSLVIYNGNELLGGGIMTWS